MAAEYESAFWQAYVSRLVQRRQRAVVWGTVTGLAVGSATAFWLLSQWLGN